MRDHDNTIRREAIIYARVSSKDQEREGYSIPAQLKLLREYASSHGFHVTQEFVDVETAKTTGRKQFGEMVKFLELHRRCQTIIVEKTDRLYRNFRDCVTLEELGVEIHLPKEGQIISRDAKSQSKLIHGIQVVIARNFIENLREEVKKGMREKAEQGIYPSRPPLGYQNNTLQRTIELDAQAAPLVRRMFDLYASGVSLAQVRMALKTEFGTTLGKSHIEKLLKNPFYIGVFEWQGITYNGCHPQIVDHGLYRRVQDAFKQHNKPKYRRHQFAFAGLLTCAYDDCSVTAEIKKEKYIYYRCTGHRGKCDLPYFREEKVGELLAEVLSNIHIPDDVLAQLLTRLNADDTESRQQIEQQRERLNSRVSVIRRRLDQAYEDKLEGKIDEAFWIRKRNEWQADEADAMAALSALQSAGNREFVLNAKRILELANKACFLYLRQDSEERAKLLKMVVSNCRVDAVSVYPTYRKPFDLIFERAKTKEWYAREDSNL